MPWKEPENENKDKPHDPWGNKNNQSPPDLDKIIGDMIKKIRDLFSLKSSRKGNGSWRKNPPPSSSNKFYNKEHHYGIAIIVAAFFLLWVLTGFFIVNPAEEAVILRFGKYSETLYPGLHWMARFIDTKYLLDVQKIYSFPISGDFLTKSSDQNDLPNNPYLTLSKSLNDQSKNLVNVELNVQYRINNPRAYLFNIVNPDGTVQEVAAGALSDVIGKMKLDEVLTTGRDNLSAGVLERTRFILKNYSAGIEVLSVTLRKVQAPDQVRRAFTDVNRADQEKATFIQQAQAYASKVVPLAQGVAARTMADATAYQQQVVLTAQANVAKYQALLKVYTGAPEVTRERMYLEAMQAIFVNSTKILVDFNSSNNMLYLPLDKLIKQKQPNSSLNPQSTPSLGQATLGANTLNSPIAQQVKNVSN